MCILLEHAYKGTGTIIFQYEVPLTSDPWHKLGVTIEYTFKKRVSSTNDITKLSLETVKS